MLIAPLVHPVVVEPRQNVAAGKLDGVLEPVLLDAALELRNVRPDEVLARQADGVAIGDHVLLAVLTQRAPQRRQRAAQARSRALVEHVWPEPRRERRAGMRAPIERQPAEQGAGTAARRWLELVSIELDRQIPKDPDPQHCPITA